MERPDAEPAWAVGQAAFEKLAEHWPPSTEPAEVRWRRGVERVARRVATDPEGSWVASDGERVRGVALALRREGIWGLSLLAVDPEAQSGGIGRALLERALDYARGTRGQIIMSSQDPRAMRTYARAGFAMQPAVAAFGVVDRSELPARLGVRDGGAGDLDEAAAIDREVRGGAHGEDLAALIHAEHRMVVLPGRGYAFHRDGSPALLAARAPEDAQRLLWAVLAASEPGREVGVMSLTQAQAWALPVVLDAGLRLEPGGPTFVRGRPGPLAPYLPNPFYL